MARAWRVSHGPRGPPQAVCRHGARCRPARPSGVAYLALLLAPGVDAQSRLFLTLYPCRGAAAARPFGQSKDQGKALGTLCHYAEHDPLKGVSLNMNAAPRLFHRNPDGGPPRRPFVCCRRSPAHPPLSALLQQPLPELAGDARERGARADGARLPRRRHPARLAPVGLGMAARAARDARAARPPGAPRRLGARRRLQRDDARPRARVGPSEEARSPKRGLVLACVVRSGFRSLSLRTGVGSSQTDKTRLSPFSEALRVNVGDGEYRRLSSRACRGD